MTTIKELMSKKYIFINKSYKNNHDLFEDIGKKLESDGYVKNSYVNALKEREKVFPTGLVTPYLNIAIPHTEAAHVIKPVISILTLENPIKFEMMGGNEGDFIDMSVVILLAINDPKSHLDVLQKLIFLLSSEKMQFLLEARSIDEIYNVITDLVNEE